MPAHTHHADAPAAAIAEPPPRVALPEDHPVIITIDGPAGTGKSTVARLLAERLGLDFLDTGAMYRAAAAIALDRGFTSDIDAGQYGNFLVAVLDADLHFDWTASPPSMLAWMRPMDDRIRERDVTRYVSTIAAIGPLRKHMVQKQRIIGHQHPRLVTEGRDQGSVAFPDAQVKFYLDADAAIRAARRAEQLRDKGTEIDERKLLQEIIERDRKDSSRTDGPLIRPEGALVVDTSPLSLDQVVEHLEKASREAFANLTDGDPR